MRTLQRMHARIRRLVLGVLLVVPLVFAPGGQPQAAVVNLDGTGVTSIDGLVVGAVTYDIGFEQGSYTSVFGTQLFSDAPDIAAEITIALNSLEPIPLLSWPPIGRLMTNRFIIPLPPVVPLVSDEFVAVFFASCLDPTFFPDPAGSCAPAPNDWNIDTGLFAILKTDASFAAWAVPTMSPVPLPAALPVFGSALAMLGVVGWRRKRRGDA